MSRKVRFNGPVLLRHVADGNRVDHVEAPGADGYVRVEIGEAYPAALFLDPDMLVLSGAATIEGDDDGSLGTSEAILEDLRELAAKYALVKNPAEAPLAVIVNRIEKAFKDDADEREAYRSERERQRQEQTADAMRRAAEAEAEAEAAREQAEADARAGEIDRGAPVVDENGPGGRPESRGR